MSQKYPQAVSEGPWWKDSSLWIQVVIQTVVFTMVGVGVQPSAAGFVELPSWSIPVYYGGLVLSFIGLLVQRWQVTVGLTLTAMSMAMVGASAVFVYFLGYLVVCYEAWYIVAFARRRMKLWMSILLVGSFATVVWGVWRDTQYGLSEPNLEEIGVLFSGVALLIVVSVALAGMIGRQTARTNERMETLAARAELATVSERNRIAREMHDIVAHSLTVVIAQADGGRYAGRKDPDKAIEALDTIAARGRDALSQMRSLLSVLNDGSGEDRATTVAPGVSGVPDLIYDAKRSGLTVEYKIDGTPVALDEVRDLTVYRVVQECLTNVMRHAGAVETKVRLAWDKDALRITVDNAPGEDTLEGSGRGLTGIAERLRVHGGTAKWGPSLLYPDGWNVTAELPLGR